MNETNLRQSSKLKLWREKKLDNFGFARHSKLRQETLYTREGYGTICVIVKQLWTWQFYHRTTFVFTVLTAYFKVD